MNGGPRRHLGTVLDTEAEAPQFEDPRIVLRYSELKDGWERNPLAVRGNQEGEEPGALIAA